MKRIIFALLLTFIIVGCEDTEDNTPGLQSSIDNVLFKATDARATNLPGTGGGQIIEGITEDERLVIRVPQAGAEVYNVSVNRRAYASYQGPDGVVYSTFPFGEGEIVMSQFNTSGGKKFTGTFKFTAFSAAMDTLYLERGIYFEVPQIEGIEIDDLADPFLRKYGSMTALVNGELFRPRDVQGVEVNGGFVIVTGVDDSGNTLRLQFTDFVEDGVTYPMSTIQYTAYYKEAGSSEEQELDGSISIIRNNRGARQVRGSFQFVTDSYEVIGGEFFSNY